MNNLPIDTSHPAVRDYLSLIRLQVLTPLSLLINIATVLVCAIVVKPSIGGIVRLHPTSISPNLSIIAPYVAVIWLGQLGYCMLLVFARKAETKQTIIKGVGLALVFSNWIMAGWAVAWVFQFFLLSTILAGLLLVLLIYSNLALLIYHPPENSRPLDTALIHAPLRFFLILPLSLIFPYCLFVTLGLTYAPTYPYPDIGTGHPWTGFGVIVGTNLLGLVVIAFRRDIVWCVAATWLAVSGWTTNQPPKDSAVYIPLIIFTILHPLVLLAAEIHAYFYARPGTIALHGHDELNSHSQAENRHTEIERGPREVDAEAVWGDA